LIFFFIAIPIINFVVSYVKQKVFRVKVGLEVLIDKSLSNVNIQTNASLKSFSPIRGRAAFMGFDIDVSQKSADRMCTKSKKRIFTPTNIKKLLLYIDKIDFGKGGRNNRVVKKLILDALSRLNSEKIGFKISSGNFGRFANMLTHRNGRTIVYLNEMFREVLGLIDKKDTSFKSKELKAKLALFFAILVHESYHKSRPKRGKMPAFVEEMNAGLKELEIYILMGEELRNLILKFLKENFKDKPNVYNLAESIFMLADSFDIEVNDKVTEYYEPRYRGKHFIPGTFTPKGKGEFISEIFMISRGEEIIPKEIKEFYYYLLKEAGKGNISMQEIGFAIMSISENLSLLGYDKDLKDELKRELKDKKYWPLLMEGFRKEIEFGTAGIRGRRGLEMDIDNEELMYLPGPNRINPDVISKYMLGITVYIIKKGWKERGLVLGFDVRKGSKELAELA